MKKLIKILSLMLFISNSTMAATFLESDIYFGLSKDDGSLISNREFDEFKQKYILTKFRKGFTTEKAHGMWLSKKIGRDIEPSRIVIVVYKKGSKEENYLKQVAEEYKKRFHQESVMVVTKSVDVKFY